MEWKDVAAKIVSLAPLAGALATPLIGPAGPLAGAAIKALAGVFGITSADPQPDQIMAAIQADPNAVLKLQTAKLDFETEKMKLEFQEREQVRQGEIEELKTRIGDVQSARNREVEIAKATGGKDRNLYVLAWVVVGGFLGLTAFLLYVSYQGKEIADQTGVVYMLLGTLSTSFGMVMGYFFGTNKDSKGKTDMLFHSQPIPDPCAPGAEKKPS